MLIFSVMPVHNNVAIDLTLTIASTTSFTL